eukprot:Hpha_TRINITY_DN24521_c0_g1::TRINITY_DN24521_c0_g1_i1::g.172555::m.172555
MEQNGHRVRFQIGRGGKWQTFFAVREMKANPTQSDENKGASVSNPEMFLRELEELLPTHCNATDTTQGWSEPGVSFEKAQLLHASKPERCSSRCVIGNTKDLKKKPGSGVG